MIHRVFIDLDGVVAQFVEQCINYLSPLDSDLSADDFDRYEIHEVLGRTLDEFWQGIRRYGYRFWSAMPKYEWADELVAFCRESWPDTAFLSSPGHEPTAAHGKMLWQQRHFADVPLILCPSKVKRRLAKHGSLLIDDSRSNCDEWIASGGQTILWPAPWNGRSRSVTWDNWFTVRSYLEELADASK